MLKFIANTYLKFTGWQLKIVLPKEKQFVLIGAPHTSNWDFPLALITFWTLDLKIYWVAKVQLFWGPLNYLSRALGGIPVDRNSTHGFVDQVTQQFKHRSEMVLTIAPEGTRSKTQYWKSGFYRIALAADVPICLGYIDYHTRKLGFEKLIYPSGDIEVDMKLISDFYDNVQGRRPECQGPVRVKIAIDH